MTETMQQPDAALVRSSDVAQWVRATRWGAVAVVIWSLALQSIAGELIPPVAAIGVAFAVLAFFLRGERRRLALVAAVMGLLTLFGNFPQTLDELMHPDSPPAFILTLLAVVAVIVVMISGVAAFSRWSPEPITAVAIGAGAIFALGVVVSLSMGATVESTDALAGDIAVTAQGVEFDPGALTAASGESGFWVDNRDGIRHTFTIESLGLEIDIPALSSQRADFELDEGQYVVTCAVPGHENMTIDLTVEG
jgi:plastocyanin